MVPAPRLLALAFVGLLIAALPTILHPQLWWLVAGLWALAGGASALDLLALRRATPTLQTSVPELVGVGGEVPVEVTMHVRGTFRARLRQEVARPLLPGGDLELRAEDGETLHRLSVHAPRRGAGALSALWTRLDGPFGLIRRIDRHAIDAPVRVVPSAERMRELLLAHFGGQRFGGVHVTRRVGEGGEFHALEGYEPGMDLRQVDWKASARHQSLRVRRYRIEQNQRLMLCVDTGRLMADGIDGLQRVDHAIHAALLLARLGLRAGDRVGMQAYGEEVVDFVPPASGMRQLARLRRSAAALAARPEETNHVVGVHALLRQLRRRSLVVIFTEFSDATTAELMIESVGHLARRHVVIFVALDDPIVEEPIGAAPADAGDLAATVVAGGLRQDRQRVLRRLRRMGVDVIHGPPGPASLQLLARYTHIKKRGRIG